VQQPGELHACCLLQGAGVMEIELGAYQVHDALGEQPASTPSCADEQASSASSKTIAELLHCDQIIETDILSVITARTAWTTTAERDALLARWPVCACSR
jgi:hypothetical protein